MGLPTPHSDASERGEGSLLSKKDERRDGKNYSGKRRI